MRRIASEPPLSGIRVLEIASGLPGPYCGQVLADLGADVIKVESLAGDAARHEGPRIDAFAAGFAMANRNKRSLALNLTPAAGREVLYRLVRTSDVLLDGHRPGVLDRLGAGYDTILREAPRIVYCSITGYGQDGPYAQRPGRDSTFAAIAGLIDQNGRRGAQPALLPTPATELAGALWAACSILAALRARDKSGKGQHIDVSLAESAVALLAPHFAVYAATGTAPIRGTTRLTGGLPGYAVYATQDGKHIALGALEDRHWRRLCELIGHPELTELRGRDDETVEATLARAFVERTRDEWVDLLADDEVGAAPVLRVDEVARDPHLVHRGVFTSFPLAGGGRLPQVGFPARLPQTPAVMQRPPPLLGEHTTEILAELGYRENEVQVLLDSGTVARQ